MRCFFKGFKQGNVADNPLFLSVLKKTDNQKNIKTYRHAQTHLFPFAWTRKKAFWQDIPWG